MLEKHPARLRRGWYRLLLLLSQKKPTRLRRGWCPAVLPSVLSSIPSLGHLRHSLPGHFCL